MNLSMNEHVNPLYPIQVLALEQGIARAEVYESLPLENTDAKFFYVVLDGKEIGYIRRDHDSGAGRPTLKAVWHYRFPSKSYWADAPSKASAINSLVHRELFA